MYIDIEFIYVKVHEYFARCVSLLRKKIYFCTSLNVKYRVRFKSLGNEYLEKDKSKARVICGYTELETVEVRFWMELISRETDDGDENRERALGKCFIYDCF